MTTATPARPALRYFGGKWMLADWIIGHFPPHKCYVEPFGGGASVLLRKPPSRIEVYNDRCGAVVNFFRVLRERPDELLAALELTPMALDEFADCQRDQETGDDVERARRLFVASWQGINGTVAAGAVRGFRRTPDRDVARSVVGAAANLRTVAERLRGVTIDNLDAVEVLRRYDRPETLFYVDPPYVPETRAESRTDKAYGANDMETGEHERLLEVLREVRGAVVLSGYACEMYETALDGWRRVERDVPSMKRTKRTEVLWVNRAEPRLLALG